MTTAERIDSLRQAVEYLRRRAETAAACGNHSAARLARLEMADKVAELARLESGLNVEFSGVPAGHSSNYPAGGTSAATQG